MFDNMIAAIDKLPLVTPAGTESGEEKSSSSSSSSVPMDLEAAAAAALAVPTAVFPEVEVFVFTAIVTTLLREHLDTDAAFAATALIDRIRGFNRRSLDQLSSKAYFYFSLAYEQVHRLENIRPTLLALYRTSCVRHDEMGQAVLLNLLLRNYLHYHLVEQAQTLSLRAAFPENASNNQFCRYLYYMGRVQATQLEYSDAYQRLMMAVRKVTKHTRRCRHTDRYIILSNPILSYPILSYPVLPEGKQPASVASLVEPSALSVFLFFLAYPWLILAQQTPNDF